MAIWQFTNSNQNGTTLNNGGNMLAGDTSCTITSAATLGSPAGPQFVILIDSELMIVGGVAGNVFSSLVRGTEGTTAAGHTNGAAVYCPVTAAMLTGAFLRADTVNAVESTGTDFKASGATGLANSASGRFVGNWTTTGAPTGIVAQLGDHGIDGAQQVWVCSVAGTPGTWIAVPSTTATNTWTQPQTFSGAVTVNADVDGKTFEATGAASLGSAISGRFVGAWTTVGAPTGLTAEVADFGFDGNVNLWVCSVAGTPGTWVPVGRHQLKKITTTAAQVNMSFQSIPAGYTNLQIVYSARDNGAGTTFSTFPMQVNNDSAGLYSGRDLDQVGSATTTGAEQTSATSIMVGVIVNGASTASFAARGVIWFPNYADAFFKGGTWEVDGEYIVGTGSNEHRRGDWSYRNTAAITRIDLLATFVAGCVGTLYGDA